MNVIEANWTSLFNFNFSHVVDIESNEIVSSSEAIAHEEIVVQRDNENDDEICIIS